MKTLRVPSLQHLARNWRPTPEHVGRVLVSLARNSPTFNYNPLYSAVRDLLVLRVPYEQVVEGIRRGVKRDEVRKNLLGVLPLVRRHFARVDPDFVQAVERRFYPVGRDLLVPFEPPLVYGVGGALQFPWFSFWRQNPLRGDALSLFVTLVDELLLQDPDLEEARFEILDFSAPNPKAARDLVVTQARDVPRLGEAAKRAMLATFAEGFRLATAELAGSKTTPDEHEEARANRQPGLCD